MAYINLFVGSDATLSIKNNQIVLKNENNQETFPLEDVDTIVIESRQSVISTYALSECALHNIVVFFCDEKHIPCASLLPYNTYYSQLKNFKLQTQLSAPFRKQLWQEIVKHKIQNQNECLRLCEKEEALKDLIKQVKSGDSTNVEAVAASKYFKVMFGNMFAREQENSINAALNYGYAILRGVIARSIVGHGLLPFLGINHHSVLNNYNLADDLIEVFRPIVDLCVYKNCDCAFNLDYRKELFGLLSCDCSVNGAKYTVSYAIELYVQSFIDSLEKEINCMKFPEILELSMHGYL